MISVISNVGLFVCIKKIMSLSGFDELHNEWTALAKSRLMYDFKPGRAIFSCQCGWVSLVK